MSEEISERIIKDPDEATLLLYSNNPSVAHWLKRVQLTSGQEDRTGILKMKANKPRVDGEALKKFLESCRAIKSDQHDFFHGLLEDGIGGIRGNILAVRETLKRVLVGGAISADILEAFSVPVKNLRTPTATNEKPCCPPEGRTVSTLNLDRFSNYDSGRISIFIAAVHEIRDAGVFAGRFHTHNCTALTPTPYSRSFSDALAQKSGNYLRNRSSSHIVIPDFSVDSAGQWFSDRIVDRTTLEAWLDEQLSKK